MKIRWTVLAAMASVAALWMATSVAFAEEWAGKSETKTAGNVQVELITQADGSRVGENNLAVQLKDVSTGQPIVRDSVKVQLVMDAGDKGMSHGGSGMSTQDPITVELKAVKETPGRFAGKVVFSNSGDWKARAVVDPRGLQTPVVFDVAVGNAGPNWTVIGSVLLVVAAAVIAVVVTVRRKPSKAASSTLALEADEA